MSAYVHVRKLGGLRYWVTLSDFPSERRHIRYGRARAVSFAHDLARKNGIPDSKVYVQESA